jgi:CRP-like cAMP-binding protein
MFDAVTFGAGDVLLHIGERPSLVYAIVEGALEMRSRDGGVTLLQRGSVVGEYGLFGSGTGEATVTALQTGRALALDHARFQHFLLAFPECSFALLRLTVERLLSRTDALPGRHSESSWPAIAD